MRYIHELKNFIILSASIGPISKASSSNEALDNCLKPFYVKSKIEI